jgi:ABC-type siderophore export system fused ATPase/permease subunit
VLITSISAVVAIIFAKILFLSLVGALAWVLPKTENTQYGILIVTIIISISCGIVCYLNIFRHLKKQCQTNKERKRGRP